MIALVKPARAEHLSSEEMTVALVDPADLSEKAGDHLRSCPSCGDELERLSAKLTGLGRMAMEYAPRTINRFELPQRKRGFTGLLSRPLALVGSGALALAILAVLGLNVLGPNGKAGKEVATLNGDLLLSPVEAELVEVEPLSDFHSFVIGQDTTALNEGFLEFVSQPLESI